MLNAVSQDLCVFLMHGALFKTKLVENVIKCKL